MASETESPVDAGAGKKLPRNVILLGWVSFFADVSGEMIYPLLPYFVVMILGASRTVLGSVEGTALAVVAVITAIAGWQSDRVRRRVPFVRWGYGLPVLGKAILAFAYAWPMVLLGRTVDRLGKGFRSSPRDALIADAVPRAMRGRAFGLHRTMDTAGAMLGVLLAAGLLWWLGVGTGSGAAPGGGGGAGGSGAGATDAASFRVIFGVAAGLGLLAWVLTLFVKESEPAGEEAKGGSGEGVGAGGAAEGKLSAGYYRVLAVLLVFSLANSSDAFLLLRAGELGMAPWAFVLAYALFNLTYTLFSYPAGVLSDKLGRWRVIGMGWVIYAGVYAGFAYTGATGIWPLMAVYGVYMALTEGVGKALVADHAPKARRGTALGIYYMASGLTTLLASVGAGFLWDQFGAKATFLVGAGLAVVAAGMIPLASGRGGGKA